MKQRLLFILICLFFVVAPCSAEKNYPVYGLSFPCTAIVNDNDLRLRKEPNLSSEVLALLDRGTRVNVYGRIAEPLAVGEILSHWYYVRTIDGLQGYCYGYYLDFPVKADENEYITEIKALSCSSEREGYTINKAFDGKTDTAWMGNTPSVSKKEYIEICFTIPITVDRIEFVLGSGKSSSRIKNITLLLDGETEVFEVSDHDSVQSIELSRKLTFSTCRFSINSVYQGTNPYSIHISEILFLYKDTEIALEADFGPDLKQTAQLRQITLQGAYGSLLSGITHSLVFSPEGNHAYISADTSDTVAWFSVDKNSGDLHYQGHFSDKCIEGVQNLAITLDGKHVYALGKQLVWFERDASNGNLSVEGAFDNTAYIPHGRIFLIAKGKYLLLNVEKKSDTSIGFILLERDVSDGSLRVLYELKKRSNFNCISAVSQDGVYLYADAGGKISLATLNIKSGELIVSGSYSLPKQSIEQEGVYRSLGVISLSHDEKHIICQGMESMAGAGGGSSWNVVYLFDRDTVTGALRFKQRINLSTSGILLEGSHLYALHSHENKIIVMTWDTKAQEYTSQDEIIFSSKSQGFTHGIIFSPDKKHSYVLTDSAVYWLEKNTATGNLKKSASWDYQKDFAQPWAMDMSPNGRHIYVAAYNDDAVLCFELDQKSGAAQYCGMYTGNYRGAFFHPSVIAVSPDGKNVYVVASVVGQGDQLFVFNGDLKTGKLQYNNSNNEISLYNAESIVISPDGRDIYVAIYDQYAKEGEIIRYSRNPVNGFINFQETFVHQVLSGAYQLAISPDGRNLYITARKAQKLVVMVRDIDTGKLRFLQDISGPMLVSPEAVVVSGDSMNVYVTSATHLVSFARNQENGKLTLISFDRHMIEYGESVKVSPDGKFVYQIRGSKLECYSRLRTSGALRIYSSYDNVGLGWPRALAISADGKYIYTCDAALDRLIWFRQE